MTLQVLEIKCNVPTVTKIIVIVYFALITPEITFNPELWLGIFKLPFIQESNF